MSQLPAYLFRLVLNIAKWLASQIQRQFDENFIHSSSRLHHWIYLVSDANLASYDLQQLLLDAILPTYVVLFWWGWKRRWGGDGGADHNAFWDLSTSLMCWILLNGICNFFLALGIIWNTPSISGKVVTAVDLWFEFSCSWIANFCLGSLVFFLAALAFGWEELLWDLELWLLSVQDLFSLIKEIIDIFIEAFQDWAEED